MPIIDDVLAQPRGARFFRADLHVHSYGASHDVKDPSMTAAAIINTGVTQRLDLIAITDHNEIDNVAAAIEAAATTDICVVPGVELSTGQGHLLCYLPTLDVLKRFHGQLSIVERGTQTSRCQQSMLECLNLLASLGGLAVLAHVDIASGFETDNAGASPHKLDVLCHPALLGIELKHATSSISYADSDPDANRVSMGRTRIERLRLGSKQHLARVLNSDAHALQMLGRNAASDHRVTRYKMDAPSFEGLRIALENADARVRIEDQIPQTTPRVLGLYLDGGFLTGQLIHFSPNLNCIIGGRGTGKSTTFEAVRCLAAETTTVSSVVDSEVWPAQITLLWQDEAGQRHEILRAKGYQPSNAGNPDGPCAFDIDCFGQGEAAQISRDAQSDPLALLRYLDKFVVLREATEAEEAACEKLLRLQQEIENAEKSAAPLQQFERQLTTVGEQLNALRKPEVKELIDLQRQLATERNMREQISSKLAAIRDDNGRQSSKGALADIRQLGAASSLALGVVEFRSIVAGVTSLEAKIAATEIEIRESVATFDSLVKTQQASWKAKVDAAQVKVDDKRRDLEKLRVPFDMAHITKLAADEASHTESIKKCKQWKTVATAKRVERGRVLKGRWEARDTVAALRGAFALQATKTLRAALTDLNVSLKYVPNAYSTEATDIIIEAMSWRTIQQVRAKALVEQLTIPKLLEAIEKNNPAPIRALRTAEDVELFKQDEAASILERLGAPQVKFALERAPLYDKPQLRLTRMVPDGKGGSRPLMRDFAKLSLGQQQSVLLALILSADSTRPLIIDQPEDNLDGEFIYKTLVPVLRHAKERRQVIIVTHNPNVAVLGDAEQIIVMKAFSDRGEIVARGSIDDSDTRQAACDILEGAQEAFLRRARMYGVELRSKR